LAGNVVRTGVTRNAYKILVNNVEVKTVFRWTEKGLLYWNDMRRWTGQKQRILGLNCAIVQLSASGSCSVQQQICLTYYSVEYIHCTRFSAKSGHIFPHRLTGRHSTQHF
jgi:hypothetical protein